MSPALAGARSETSAARADAGRCQRCPISGTPCPGECIYADVMESPWLGVVVFDVGRAELHFVNSFARELFERLGQRVDYPSLSALLLAEAPECQGDPGARTIRIGSRLVGYTAYRARGFAWAYVRDITEKARLESIAEAVQTMNNMGYVFSAVRHEIGNPINSIKAALSVLRANVDRYSTETLAEYLDRMSAEVGRVENLLRSLKSFSLYERPAMQPLNVGPFLDQFVRFVSDDAHARGISLSAATDRECWALCDPRALQQVMLNLYANASDAVQARESPELRIVSTMGEGLINVLVADNGRGISQADLPNVFKPFFTTKEHGTGLGLVISRKLLAKMGATITLASTEGTGTIAHVALPESSPCPTSAGA